MIIFANTKGITIVAMPKAALERLKNQRIIADIAKNHDDFNTSWEALEKLTDQKIIADVAKKCTCFSWVKSKVLANERNFEVDRPRNDC